MSWLSNAKSIFDKQIEDHPIAQGIIFNPPGEEFFDLKACRFFE